MSLHRTAIVSILVLLAISSIASAGLLDPVSIERQAYALHQIGVDDQQDDYTAVQNGVGVQPFSASVVAWDGFDGVEGTHQYSIAHQASTITANTISMTGSAGGTYYGQYHTWRASYAHSSLRETFILSSPTPFTFAFGWDVSETYSEANVQVYLTGPSGDVFRQTRATTDGIGTWTTQGYLAPGQYEYFVRGGISAYQPSYPLQDRTVSFSADFALIPEPATLTLAALGTLGLLRRRR